MSYLFDTARLLTDPKLKFTNDNGKPRAICELFLVFANPKRVPVDVSATGWKNREFKVNATVFDEVAEKVAALLKSGDPVFVTGNLVWPTFTDKNTGEEKATHYQQLYIDTINPDIKHLASLHFNERKSHPAAKSPSPVLPETTIADVGCARESLSDFEQEFLIETPVGETLADATVSVMANDTDDTMPDPVQHGHYEPHHDEHASVA